MLCIELFISSFLNWVIRTVIVLTVAVLKIICQTFESQIKFITDILTKIVMGLIN